MFEKQIKNAITDPDVGCLLVPSVHLAAGCPAGERAMVCPDSLPHLLQCGKRVRLGDSFLFIRE